MIRVIVEDGTKKFFGKLGNSFYEFFRFAVGMGYFYVLAKMANAPVEPTPKMLAFLIIGAILLTADWITHSVRELTTALHTAAKNGIKIYDVPKSTKKKARVNGK